MANKLWNRFSDDDAKGGNEAVEDHLQQDLLLFDFQFKHSEMRGGFDFVVMKCITTSNQELELRSSGQAIVSFLKNVYIELQETPDLIPAPVKFYKEGRMTFIGQSSYDFESAGIEPSPAQLKMAALNMQRSQTNRAGAGIPDDEVGDIPF